MCIAVNVSIFGIDDFPLNHGYMQIVKRQHKLTLTELKLSPHPPTPNRDLISFLDGGLNPLLHVTNFLLK